MAAPLVDLKSQVENTGSGVLAVPKRVRRTWVELKRPDCFTSEDLQPAR